LQHNSTKKARATAVAFFCLLWSCAAAQFHEEGDGTCRRLLLSTVELRCNATEEGDFVAELCSSTKKATAAAVAFFLLWSCCTAKQATIAMLPSPSSLSSAVTFFFCFFFFFFFFAFRNRSFVGIED